MQKGLRISYMTRPPRGGWEREDTRKGSIYLVEILKLFYEGWSSVAIGRKFNKDHTTILYHLRKMGIPCGFHRTIIEAEFFEEQKTVVIQKPVKVSKYDYLLDEPVVRGMNYGDYLEKSGKTKEEVKRIITQKARVDRGNGDGGTLIPIRFDESLRP